MRAAGFAGIDNTEALAEAGRSRTSPTPDGEALRTSSSERGHRLSWCPSSTAMWVSSSPHTGRQQLGGPAQPGDGEELRDTSGALPHRTGRGRALAWSAAAGLTPDEEAIRQTLTGSALFVEELSSAS